MLRRLRCVQIFLASPILSFISQFFIASRNNKIDLEKSFFFLNIVDLIYNIIHVIHHFSLSLSVI